MTISKNTYRDIRDRMTNGEAAANVVNDNRRAVNEVIDIVNLLRGAAFKDEGFYLTPEDLQILLSPVSFSNDFNDLINKPDLEALAGIQVYPTLGDFPSVGLADKLYIANDTGNLYRYTPTGYVRVTNTTGIWGNIQGSLSNQTDLKSALDSKVDKEVGKGLFSGSYDDLDDKPVLGSSSSKDITQSLTESFNDDDVPTNKAVVDFVNSFEGLSYKGKDGVIVDGDEISIDDSHFGAAAFSDVSDFVPISKLDDIDNAVKSDELADVAFSGDFGDLENTPNFVELNEQGKIDGSIVDKGSLNLSTDDVTEATRKYFTEQRARDAVISVGYAMESDLIDLENDVTDNYAKKVDVHNSVISISFENEQVGSFTLNQSSNKNINLSLDAIFSSIETIGGREFE